MPGQPFGASNQFARPAARPRSPLALTLPIMNIIAGLPLPVMSLRNSTGPITSDRSGLPRRPPRPGRCRARRRRRGVAAVTRSTGDPEVDAGAAVAGLVGTERLGEAREDRVEDALAVRTGEVVADLLVGHPLDEGDELRGLE